MSGISVILYVDLLKYCYSGHGGLNEIWLKLFSLFFFFHPTARKFKVACEIHPCGLHRSASWHSSRITLWMDRRGSFEKGHKWLKMLWPSARSFLNLPPLLLERAVGLQHLGWGGGAEVRSDPGSPSQHRKRYLQPGHLGLAEIADRASDHSRFLLSLPADLLRNSPIPCPDPPPLPMLSEKQADTFVQQWRHKFALSLNSSWSFFFLYQLLEFFNFSNTMIWKNFELLPSVLCCAMVLCILTCSGTCKLLIYAECLLQCSAL